jgi:hypothetical protein|tara:strand:- start:115 stop:495 length:381 start_codon:yes stop_codon:yes gene_type:complete
MKPLLVEILECALEVNSNYHYRILNNGELIQPLTRDISLAFDQKENNEYVSMSNLDEVTIEFWDCSTEEEIENSETNDDYLAWIDWRNWDRGIDRCFEDHTNKRLKIRETMDNWEKKYELLKENNQ